MLIGLQETENKNIDPAVSYVRYSKAEPRVVSPERPLLSSRDVRRQPDGSLLGRQMPIGIVIEADRDGHKSQTRVSIITDVAQV